MARRPDPHPETDAEIRRAVNTEPTAIQEEYCAVPADIHRWAGIVAERDEVLDVAEAELKIHEAEEAKKIVDSVPAGEKVPGEGVRQDRVRAGKGYRERVMAVARARRGKAEAMAVLEAVRAKRELLVSLGADIRQQIELADGPTIRDRRARRA